MLSVRGKDWIVMDAAVRVLLSPDAAAKLSKEGAAAQRVMDSFGHLKPIGFNAEAKPLLDKAGAEPDEGGTDFAGFIEAATNGSCNRKPDVRKLAPDVRSAVSHER